jgi:hypothetical protein
MHRRVSLRQKMRKPRQLPEGQRYEGKPHRRPLIRRLRNPSQRGRIVRDPPLNRNPRVGNGSTDFLEKLVVGPDPLDGRPRRRPQVPDSIRILVHLCNLP